MKQLEVVFEKISSAGLVFLWSGIECCCRYRQGNNTQ